MNELPEDIKQRIIVIAQDLFGRFGFKKTTLADIARALHMAKSSLYHYFANKEEIFTAVVEKEVNLLKKEMLKSLKQDDDPQKKLRNYGILRMQAVGRFANFYSTFKDDYLEQYSFVQRLRQNYDRYEIETIKSILKEGVDKGIFVVRDLDTTAFTIVTALKGLEYPWAMEPDPIKIMNGIEALCDIFFNGILKK